MSENEIECSPRKRRKITTRKTKESTKDTSKVLKNRHTGKIQSEENSKWTLPDYDPAFFVRCHSNKPADDATKVWRCSFQPTGNADDHIVATCGGEYVCFIDLTTGKLMKRYQQSGEDFYAMAWTTLLVKGEDGERKETILAAAGMKGVIYLIHPIQNIVYKDIKAHNKYIGSLLFHPCQPTLLFSGSHHGRILLTDIGTPRFPDYTVQHRQLLVLQSPGRDVLNMAFIKDHLITGCAQGCYVWKINSQDPKKTKREPVFEVVFPVSKIKKEDAKLVDSLVQLSQDIIVSKVSSCMYMWRFSEALRCVKKGISAVTPLRLQWTEDPVVYINIGAHHDLVVCGDADGTIWMYDVEDYIGLKKSNKVVTPARKLYWPQCDAPSNMKDLQKDPEKIIVNCASVSQSHEYIVCVTENNLVCIWKKM